MPENAESLNQFVQHQVDQLLLEQGEYVPLEFLLREGRLLYCDYEAWRNGETDFLDEALFGDPGHIQQQLRQAEDYLQQLGWQEEPVNYAVWNNKNIQASPQTLHFSVNSELNQCFHRRYRKPQDQPQMDLFTDAPATILVNGIMQALTGRNMPEARRQLERLFDIAPDNVRVGELERLVEAAENLYSPVRNAAAEMQTLRESVAPLAANLLGKDGRNLLIPLWRRLSAALQDQPYQSAEPELHLSYTASQALDWETVRRAVENESDWQTHPVLLLRHATACDYLHEQSIALQSWFKLCWRFPEQCGALESGGNHELRQQWMEFLELEPELPAAGFPAWLLLNKPGLTRILPDPALLPGEDTAACPVSYRVLYQLQQHALLSHTGHGNGHGNERNPHTGNENIIALRAQLKEQDPALFRHYLGHIGTSS